MRPISESFTSRVKPEIAESFRKISSELDKKPAHLIRELIIATVENRIKITPKNINGEYHKNLYT